MGLGRREGGRKGRKETEGEEGGRNGRTEKTQKVRIGGCGDELFRALCVPPGTKLDDCPASA